MVNKGKEPLWKQTVCSQWRILVRNSCYAEVQPQVLSVLIELYSISSS
jgi:hypothetical protein